MAELVPCKGTINILAGLNALALGLNTWEITMIKLKLEVQVDTAFMTAILAILRCLL